MFWAYHVLLLIKSRHMPVWRWSLVKNSFRNKSTFPHEHVRHRTVLPSVSGVQVHSWGLCGAAPLTLPLTLCSPEQSNDDLVMEILSDIMVQLPLTVENEEASGPESQCTFKFIMSSSMWEKLQSNVEGEWRSWASPAEASSAKTLTLEEGRGSPQREVRWHREKNGAAE